MKRMILMAVILTTSLVCKAQYNNYYNPYLYAAIAAETDDTYRLNNIRFDENAIRQNPVAWSAYQDYLGINSEYVRKSKIYSTIAWTGLGVSCVSLIPMYMSLDYSYDDPKGDAMMNWSIGLLCAGGVAAIMGGLEHMFN